MTKQDPSSDVGETIPPEGKIAYYAILFFYWLAVVLITAGILALLVIAK